jgi:hypothetical protein
MEFFSQQQFIADASCSFGGGGGITRAEGLDFVSCCGFCSTRSTQLRNNYRGL